MQKEVKSEMGWINLGRSECSRGKGGGPHLKSHGFQAS